MAEQVSQEIHDRIARFLQGIEEETGVVVTYVHARWLPAGMPEKDKHILLRTSIETHKRAG